MGRADIEVPNAPVDVGSRGTLACYPRSTFYPVIDGPPTWSHRVTKPRFRGCSARQPHSQAPLCLCTLHTVSNRAEGTFGSLRYSSGGRHPSETAHLRLSPRAIHPGVSLQTGSGWYLTGASTPPGEGASQAPTYPAHPLPRDNPRLQ